MTVYNQSVPDQDLFIRAHINENHFGFSPMVFENLKLMRMNLYPDPGSLEIRKKIASFHGVDPDMVAVGNGTDEIILMIALAFLKPSIKALLVTSSFPGYLTSARACRAEHCLVTLNSYKNPVEEIGVFCREHKSVVFLCNPHNPTGTLMSEEQISWLIDQAQHSESLVVIDEAYGEFAGQDFSSAIAFVRKNKGIIATRTFSKAYGLAGFRIGYAIGQPEDIAAIRAAQCTLPFCVNRLAQAVAPMALQDQGFLAHVIKQTNDAKACFYEYLDSRNIQHVKSYSNSVLIKVKDSVNFSAILQKDFGILVRDTSPFGLHDHVRITMCLAQDMKKINSAIDSIINNWDLCHG